MRHPPRAVPPQHPSSHASVPELKAGLLSELYGTARGCSASQEQRARIEEYISALEARNPYSAPTDVGGGGGGRKGGPGAGGERRRGARGDKGREEAGGQDGAGG